MLKEFKKGMLFVGGQLKRYWNFLQEDSLKAVFVFLVTAILFLVLIFFPCLRLLTGSDYPLVIVESCSMYHHDYGFENTFTSPIYGENNISINDTDNWIFPNGLKKGDIIFIVEPKNLEKGDVIIFSSGRSSVPIIHRLVDDVEPYATKGDNYISNSGQFSEEMNIIEEQVLGKAVFRIPGLGWIKLILFDWRNPAGYRGFCN